MTHLQQAHYQSERFETFTDFNRTQIITTRATLVAKATTGLNKNSGLQEHI